MSLQSSVLSVLTTHFSNAQYSIFNTHNSLDYINSICCLRVLIGQYLKTTKMLRCTRFLSNLEKINVDYPEDKIFQINNEFLRVVEEICDGLLNVEIVYTCLTLDSHMCHIIKYLSSIIKHFQNVDITEPLDVINFTLFMKLSRLTTKFKTLVISELIDDNFIIKNDDHLFNYEKEECICNTYKSKLKYFKTNSDNSEIYMINEHFTNFLIEYVRLLSKLKTKDIPLEKNIKLLLDVASDEILAKNFHFISDILPQTTKLIILQKITNCIIKPEFNLQDCEFLQSKNKDYKLEICAVIFFTLQNICEHLENENINQSSLILSKFNVESVISLIDSSPDFFFESTFEESTKLITFKKYKKVKEIPSEKIKKCLQILELLNISLRCHQVQIKNSPFSLVLLSILSEFVMATSLDNFSIIKLITIIIGFLKICGLPMHFSAVSFAFNIYQKLKSDDELEPKLVNLFKSISIRLNKDSLQKQYITKDLEKIIHGENNWVDTAIIVSCFLGDLPETRLISDKCLIDIYNDLNEYVILSSNYMCSQNHLLIYPYCISLNFSIINQKDDCLFNNLAVLDDYITILFNENVKVQLEDKKFFLSTIFKHYDVIAHCIPKEFLLKCWEYILNPMNMDDKISKKLLDLCSSNDLIKFISILKTETIKLIEGNEPAINQDYYEYIHELWSFLLNIQLFNQKKKIRKDNINHFCFVLNRTFLFNTKKIQTEQGLILLLKLVCALLQVPWINKTTMMNCSLRIMTFVEKSKSKAAQLLIEASELLIVLYKCPNNSIKPYLGLYATTFANFLKKCLSSVCQISTDTSLFDKNYYIPFHKLEKCSSLFKQNKSDFDIICRYIIEDLIELVSVEINFVGVIMKHYFNVIFNMMDVCSPDEMKKLMLNIQGPSLLMLTNAYKEYRSNVRFTGRL
ncbi:LOW QUALITY PROTEIN: uncharacterized protein LOC112598649 [Melanaphis sacchari]|uniref:LOW QUALITY PROTEIN: uncharacterized protein LOC112598649 n=1 Tax=Melanaphis sacchari TaxID=742174 RepID=UPI000DC12CFD|nr:LOW QUALITY PROTEIN: uncharacterized protein LOC112598649 [Melanaphis sacchari]